MQIMLVFIFYVSVFYAHLINSQPGTICKYYEDISKVESCSSEATFVEKPTCSYFNTSLINATIKENLQKQAIPTIQHGIGELDKVTTNAMEKLSNRLSEMESQLVNLTDLLEITKKDVKKYIRSCPVITFHLPRDNQTKDYVRYRSFVPRMEEATICAWVETYYYNESYTSLASYATTGSSGISKWRLGWFGSTNIGIGLDNKEYSTAINELNFEKFHICQWFSSSQKKIGIYINGVSITKTVYPGDIVSGGGDFILGQDHDDVDAGKILPQEALQRNITNFMIWTRVLTEDEIKNIVYNCECPRDYSVVMTMDRVELFGETSYSIPDVCPALQ